jgi:hypothetical protein
VRRRERSERDNAPLSPRLGFLAILFLQSGIDKVVDRRGNLEWLNGHFAKSPLADRRIMLLS